MWTDVRHAEEDTYFELDCVLAVTFVNATIWVARSQHRRSLMSAG